MHSNDQFQPNMQTKMSSRMPQMIQSEVEFGWIYETKQFGSSVVLVTGDGRAGDVSHSISFDSSRSFFASFSFCHIRLLLCFGFGCHAHLWFYNYCKLKSCIRIDSTARRWDEMCNSKMHKSIFFCFCNFRHNTNTPKEQCVVHL